MLAVPDIPIGSTILSDYLDGSALALSSLRTTYHAVQSVRFPTAVQTPAQLRNVAYGVAEMGLVVAHYYAMRKYVELYKEELADKTGQGRQTDGLVFGMVAGIYLPLGIKMIADFWTPLPVQDKVINFIADAGVLSLLATRQHITTNMVINEDTCRKFPNKEGCPAPSSIA